MNKSLGAGLLGSSFWATFRLYLVSIMLVGWASMVLYTRHGAEVAFAATPLVVCIVIMLQYLALPFRSVLASKKKADPNNPSDRPGYLSVILLPVVSFMILHLALILDFVVNHLGSSSSRLTANARGVMQLTSDILAVLSLLAVGFFVSMAIDRGESDLDKERSHSDESS